MHQGRVLIAVAYSRSYTSLELTKIALGNKKVNEIKYHKDSLDGPKFLNWGNSFHQQLEPINRYYHLQF